MAKKGSFVQVRQTSSAQVTEEGGRGMEGRVRASSDLTITVDFPLAISHQDDVPVSTSADPVRQMNSCDSSDIGRTPPQKDKMTPTMTKVFRACNKYGQVATFHGMHTICARNVSRLRRLFWVIVIITCLTVLGVIVRERIIYFNSNPSTINVARKYEKSIAFPAVTICNGNQYSISKAYDLQLNDVLQQLITPDGSEKKIKYSEDQGKIRMNELNIMLGNNIENMLLSCQWHEGGDCGPQNFSEIITDGGRCYTFNGQKNSENMEVNNIGSEKGVRFLINTEEYERMPLSSMSSGIRILIHEQQVYPLVKQLGQSIAPGNHAFISLQLKKEIRLGPPFDNCQDGNLRFIPNNYHYTLPACQTECYFAHTLAQCGCSDFFIPARNYHTIEDNICECRTPCVTDYIDADYSYGALSELAMETLKKETVKNIAYRHRRAVDIYEFISRETQYKKDIFFNFTTVLDRAKELYASDLNMLETKVTQTLADCSNRYNKLCDTINEILRIGADYQRIAELIQRMDRTTVGKFTGRDSLGDGYGCKMTNAPIRPESGRPRSGSGGERYVRQESHHGGGDASENREMKTYCLASKESTKTMCRIFKAEHLRRRRAYIICVEALSDPTGSEKGVRFLINTEEYERMPLSSMSSGIRILIHEQQVYPLVKQLGQSISPGNHAFISLQLKKVRWTGRFGLT
ncbi:hypothetical protein Btru_026051 [Bulinus truncatus]|nr:hypothetical protein Btru_026051 [Bulinus truncatus]